MQNQSNSTDSVKLNDSAGRRRMGGTTGLQGISLLCQIRILTRVSLKNLFGYNEFRHGKDRKKRGQWILLAAAWTILVVMLAAYVVLMAVGLVKAGMADVIPELLYLITSLVILFFSVFKAGSVIFQMSTYEMLISLPVTKTAIVVSRFLTMYVTDLALSLLVIWPGMAVYGFYERPGVLFYVFGLLGIIFLPLFPITLATAFGAVITAISARMRHKSLVATGFSFLLIAGILAGSMGLGAAAEHLTVQMILDLTAFVTLWIQNMYPMAVWFNESTVGGSIGHFLMLAVISIVPFLLMTAAVSGRFLQICSALSATSAKNNYKMKSLKTFSVRRALFHRELKRYFASSIYVLNTTVGYLMMAIAAAGLFFFGQEKLELIFEISGMLRSFWPLMLAFLGSMIPTTACAVSMEGKQWWIVRTLPVSSRDLFDSKILVNLVIAFPAYLIAVIFSLLSLRPSLPEAVWILLVPAVYIVFSAVAGIAVNLRFPLFNWENETRVVKQSASVSVMLLVDLLVDMPPVLCLIFLRSVPEGVILLGTVLILAALTAVLYMHNNRKDLRTIS